MSEKVKDRAEVMELLKQAESSPEKSIEAIIAGKLVKITILTPSHAPKTKSLSHKGVKKASKKTQEEIIETLHGAWPIDETADDLIDRIKSMRKNSEIISFDD